MSIPCLRHIDECLPTLQSAWTKASQDNRPTRILFILFSGLGDVIAATGVLARVRQEHPLAHIAWLTSEANAAIAQACKAVDIVITSPDLNPCGPKVRDFLQRAHFDFVYSPSFIHNLREWERSNLHAIPFMLAMCGLLGEAHEYPKPQLISFAEDQEKIKAEWPTISLEKTCVAIAPHSLTMPPWPFEHFSALAKRLIETGYTVIQLGSARDKKIEGCLDFRARPLREAREVIARCAAYIGNDSGPTWLALTTSTPTLAIMNRHFKTTLPKEARVVGFSPFGATNRVFEVQHSISVDQLTELTLAVLSGQATSQNNALPKAQLERGRFLSLLQGATSVESLYENILAQVAARCAPQHPQILSVGTCSVSAIARCDGNVLIEPEYRWLHEHFSRTFDVIRLDAHAINDVASETLRGAVNWLHRNGLLMLEGTIEQPAVYEKLHSLPKQFPGIEIYDSFHAKGVSLGWVT